MIYLVGKLTEELWTFISMLMPIFIVNLSLILLYQWTFCLSEDSYKKFKRKVFTYLWHDHWDWIGCLEHWLWVIHFERWLILIFYILFELKWIVFIFATTSDWDRFWIKVLHIWTSDLLRKIKIEYCRHVTFPPSPYHIWIS